jgi:hypothetical protein
MRYSCICAVTFLSTLIAFAQQTKEIRGDYLETRSNQVYGCYCEWSGQAITAGREAILGWTFRTGEYHGVDLAGVKVAAVIVGQSSLSATTGPRGHVLFFDPSTSKDQQQAAQAFLTQEYGDLLGKVIAVRVMPVEIRENSDEVHLVAGDFVGVSMRKAKLPEDAMKGAQLWYDPFIKLTESTLATTLDSRYMGPEFDLTWDDTNPGVKGYYGRFSVKPR